MQALLSCFFCLLLVLPAWSQPNLPYQDDVFEPFIKSVQLYNSEKEQSFPLITLGGNDSLKLSFDDLSKQSTDYSYTIIHCSASWQPSDLSSLDYLSGFESGRLNNPPFSANTYQKYANYTLTLPNDQIKPLLSGNYVLKVYETGNPNQPIITRRFYVYDPQLQVSISLQRPINVADRNSKQQINLALAYPGLVIQNPEAALKIMVMQNDRPDVLQTFSSATWKQAAKQLEYKDENARSFWAGAEFRRFDIRNLRFKTERMASIQPDSVAPNHQVYLQPDKSLAERSYTSDSDLNGNFFISAAETLSPNINPDYASVHFSLTAQGLPIGGAYYVYGKFTDWQITEAAKMNLNPQTKQYETTLLLKQGVYDYSYVYLPKGKSKATEKPLQSNHFETENQYRALVYYRNPDLRYDQLIGETNLNTSQTH